MANDFSGDPNCKAYWRFEDGALTVDSIGTNTLTDYNTVGVDTVDFQEGAACADFEEDNVEAFHCDDADLDVGFPLRSDDVTKDFSIASFFKCESSGSGCLFNKSRERTGFRSLKFIIIESFGNMTLQFYSGYNSGASYEVLKHESVLSVANWYFACLTYQNSDRAYRIHIYDIDAGVVLGSDKTGTVSNEIYVAAGHFALEHRRAHHWNINHYMTA